MGSMGGMTGANDLRLVAFVALNDDGPQGSATEIAAKNQDWTQEAVGDQLVGRRFRLRFLVEHDVAIETTDSFVFSFALNDGFDQTISLTSSPVRRVGSAHLVHHEDSIDYVGRLGTGLWQVGANGGVITDGAGDHTIPLLAWGTAPLKEIEVEICLELVGDDLIEGDQLLIYPIEYLASGTRDFDVGYTETPTVTVAKTRVVAAAGSLSAFAVLAAQGQRNLLGAASIPGLASMIAAGESDGLQPGLPTIGGVLLDGNPRIGGVTVTSN